MDNIPVLKMPSLSSDDEKGGGDGTSEDSDTRVATLIMPPPVLEVPNIVKQIHTCN